MSGAPGNESGSESELVLDDLARLSPTQLQDLMASGPGGRGDAYNGRVMPQGKCRVKRVSG
jgi:hypothetical protein